MHRVNGGVQERRRSPRKFLCAKGLRCFGADDEDTDEKEVV